MRRGLDFDSVGRPREALDWPDVTMLDREEGRGYQHHADVPRGLRTVCWMDDVPLCLSEVEPAEVRLRGGYSVRGIAEARGGADDRLQLSLGPAGHAHADRLLPIPASEGLLLAELLSARADALDLRLRAIECGREVEEVESVKLWPDIGEQGGWPGYDRDKVVFERPVHGGWSLRLQQEGAGPRDLVLLSVGPDGRAHLEHVLPVPLGALGRVAGLVRHLLGRREWLLTRSLVPFMGPLDVQSRFDRLTTDLAARARRAGFDLGDLTAAHHLAGALHFWDDADVVERRLEELEREVEHAIVSTERALP